MRGTDAKALGDRLRKARQEAGFAGAKEAAAWLGVNANTYGQHDNGTRGFGRDKAEMYARRFRVNIEWLLTGKGPMRPKADGSGRRPGGQKDGCGPQGCGPRRSRKRF